MPAVSFRLVVHRGRTRDFTLDLFEVDGTTPITLAADDVVRVKVYRGNAAEPILDLDSIAPSLAGSTVEFTAGTNDVQLRIAQGDTSDLNPGAYDVDVDVVDNSDHMGTSPQANAVKHAETGVAHVMGAAEGEMGDEESSSSS